MHNYAQCSACTTYNHYTCKFGINRVGSGYWTGRKSLMFGPTDRKQTLTQTYPLPLGWGVNPTEYELSAGPIADSCFLLVLGQPPIFW